MQSSKDIFLTLVRSGIGHETEPIPNQVNWSEIKTLADRQGLSAVVLDGIERLPNGNRPSKNITLPWIGEVVSNYEQRYHQYCNAIASLASFYNSHGIKMMVLKGYACSLDWLKPNHRPCGDIDIWLFGKQKEADDLIRKEKNIKIDTSHHHHTVFYWRDFIVENHYDFVNIYSDSSSAKLEKIFKELGTDDSHFVGITDASTGSVAKVYLPSPNLHAMFLIRHMVSHFASSEINLRQVLDWAFFVEKHTKEIDWEWLLRILDKYHMRDFFNLINAICIEDLSFAADLFPEVRFIPELKDRVLVDILEPAYRAVEPASLLPRIVYKYRRWQGNAWKQELCYSESRWEMFRKGIWAKILKPASI